MIHITDGESAALSIGQTGVPGEVLSWKDILHEGPVPQGMSLEELRIVRSRFIADSGWDTYDEALSEFARRDRILAESLSHNEVVLWFGHDLFDQLQLIQLLDWFACQDFGATALSLICDAECVGPSSAQRLRERFPGRHRISSSELKLGQKAWTSFRSPNPVTITELLTQDTSALPFLRGALRRHLQQFPSVKRGLSRSEAQILEAIADGVARLGNIYIASHQKCEEVIFLGNTAFALYVERLSRIREPLILRSDGELMTSPRGAADCRVFWTSEVKLTDAGRRVLEARNDHVKLNGVNRWLGGVHLSGHEAHWRWDEESGQLREILT